MVGLFNNNSLVIDMPAVYIVTVYRYIDVLNKGLYRVLYRVLHNTYPPNVAG